jgi:hypothetical protein
MGKNLEGCGHVLVEVFMVINWREKENCKNTSVRIASVAVKIQTKHLLNTSLEYYRYTNLSAEQE